MNNIKNFLLYFCGFAIVFFIAPAICTATPSKNKENKENLNVGTELATESNTESTTEVPTGQESEDTEPAKEPENRMIKLLHSNSGEVEEVNLNEYLYGVVASEMPVSYEFEALKAQAVVARTYTIYQINNNAKKHENADICDSYACCQAWISKEDRFAKWNAEEAESNWNKIKDAVESTTGKIVTYNGSPINAFFHSNSGGVTESSVNVWGGIDYPYLKSVETAGEDGYSQYNSQVKLTKQELLQKLKEKHPDCEIDFSEENCIQILENTTSGRVKTIKFGNIEIAGTEARTILGLKSTNFTFSINGEEITFSVIGYGHGVGMSQTGANSMAQAGANYEEIIKHFYTDVEISELNSLLMNNL